MTRLQGLLLRACYHLLLRCIFLSADSILSLKKAGYKNIENIVYKDMLHEVLNEVNKEQVYKDVLDFLEK